MYALSIENSHGTSASAVSSITGSGTWTSRSTLQFNGTLNRLSLFTHVPASNYTGTLVISFGATTQTGALWSLIEFSNVDTTSSDGIVQTVTATGNGTSASVTMGSFTSSNNATVGIAGTATTSTHTAGAGVLMTGTSSIGTPSQSIGAVFWHRNVGSPSQTLSLTGQWAMIGFELALGTASLIIPAHNQPNPLYFGFTVNGSTDLLFEQNGGSTYFHMQGSLYAQSSYPLTPTVNTTQANAVYRPIAGFTSRSTAP
jgi:hypothetical protein